jgi:hypothetical protein
VNASVPHGGDEARAKRIALSLMEENRARMAKYHPEIRLTRPDLAEFSFHAVGRIFTGSVQITATSIELDIAVPFALRPFAAVFIERARSEISARLARP